LWMKSWNPPFFCWPIFFCAVFYPKFRSLFF
jgi:hypothetical protein